MSTDNTIKSWIEERRRIREHEPTMFERADTEVAYPRTLNALEQVLELHKPNTSKFRVSVWCASECKDSEGNIEQYPCRTVQAIEGAIND